MRMRLYHDDGTEEGFYHVTFCDHSETWEKQRDVEVHAVRILDDIPKFPNTPPPPRQSTISFHKTYGTPSPQCVKRVPMSEPERFRKVRCIDTEKV